MSNEQTETAGPVAVVTGARGIGVAVDIAVSGAAAAVSDDAAYITGQTLSVSGGLTMA